MLTFPPLVKNWTVKGEPNWPGAEYTRRTRMKTTLEEDVSAEFMDELKATVGEKCYEHYCNDMHPAINRKLLRGKPPDEKGAKKIQPQYQITRADAPEPGDDNDPMMGTTMSLSGHLSKTKVSECMYTSWGPVPEFMFDDREKMRSLSDWFEKYGRPTPNAINLGPRQLYTHYDKSTRRCCGEESHVTRMHKGFLTA